MFELTGFQRDLLYVIAGLEEPSGQTIKSHLEEAYENEINHGRLYPNLDTLVEDGYVEKGWIDRRTNCYVLTPMSEESIQSRRQWENEYLDLDVALEAD